MTREIYEMKPHQLAGGGTKQSRQVQLGLALQSGDYATFEKLISKGDLDLEHIYQRHGYKTCLEMAVSKANRQKFVKLLLHRVQVNNVNETHSAAPIHFAVDNANKDALFLLLEDDRIDVNIKYKGNSALLMAINKIKDLDDNHNKDLAIYEDMVEMLLKAGCNANSPDSKGVTPVYSAAKQGLERVITLILDYAKEPVNLDTYEDWRGKTARDLLKKAFPHLESRFDSSSPEGEVVDNDKLFYYISRHEEDNFVRDFTKLVNKNEHQSAMAANNGTGTMLQLATEKGLERIVSTLLNFKANPNATCSSNTNRPIAIACHNGYVSILRMLIDNKSILFGPVNGESLLQTAIKGMGSYSKPSDKIKFNECLNILLKHPKMNVNHTDIKNNTALHYAARNGDDGIVIDLLKKGACVGIRNKFNVLPLADINPKTLETYLDECITTNSERPCDDDYEIRMEYSFLVYPNEPSKVSLMDNTNNNNKEFDAVKPHPETDSLLYMTRNEELRPLLNHPVITSFLYLKWQRISCLFYANITFYIVLWLCLIFYILSGYGVENNKSDLIEALNMITFIGVIIGLIILIIREVFQLLLSLPRYWQSIENLMEIGLIVVTLWMVCSNTAEESTKQQLSAIAILLSSAELVLLIGQYPLLSTYYEMLKTVSWNFFKFLFWCFILLFAFALSFYTLFRQNVVKDQKAPDPNITDKEDEEEDFFQDLGRSLFKTIVMMTGEFDSGSIKFSTFPVTSHIIFIIFVFMIPIVLFNLLNGLAVNDTQKIKADAELLGHISRVKLISYFESVLMGNARSYSIESKCWFWLPCSLQEVQFIKPIMMFLARRINLFPHFLPEYKIIVKPNQDYYKIEIPHAKPLGKFWNDCENGGCCIHLCQNYKVERQIVKNAKLVISKKTNLTEFGEIKDRLTKYESKIESLEATLEKVLHSLESNQMNLRKPSCQQ